MAKSKQIKERFIPTNNDLSYYPLLFQALEETKSGRVIEMGCGNGSTQLLHDYCLKYNRELWSYEEKEEWFKKFTHLSCEKHAVNYVADWDVVTNNHKKVSVIFIDHAPGERREIDIVNFHSKADIIVCHDTEPAADHGYQMRKHFKHFKYVIEVETTGAWATAISNTIDITKWNGLKFGNYTIGK